MSFSTCHPNTPEHLDRWSDPTRKSTVTIIAAVIKITEWRVMSHQQRSLDYEQISHN